MRVAVFCGSSFGASDTFERVAKEVATGIVQRGAGVVYGGGDVGLMGVVADTAMRAGGEVIGVMPRILVDREVPKNEITELRIVDTMHERKATMAELSEGFIVLPGGIGTLEEFFEVWTWQQIGIHDKPVVLLNVDGFWNPLIDMTDSLVAGGFVKKAFRDTLVVVDNAADAVAAALPRA